MSYKVYPVTETELSHEGYEVKINGQTVKTNTARVSAMPFNRRWPGHQRSVDQTELVSFLSLETDEVLHFEIRPLQPFQEVKIRPLSLGISPRITTDGSICFTLEKPAYFTIEPFGRENALHIFADPLQEGYPEPEAENVLYYGPGEHDVGMIRLESNQTLFIDEGAVVYACVHAVDAQNIRILGRGILDNSRNREQILFEANEKNNEMAVNNAVRLHTIQLEYCENIEIEGITVRDSLVYNIRPIACGDLKIRNVKIIGCWRYNSDGIDMHNCENVEIDNCFLRTFDDSVCIKGFDCYYEGDVETAVQAAMYRNGKCYDVFRNVRVNNCVIWNDWGKCLEIGAETRAEEICDVVFENCHIIHVTGTALDCCNVDYADVHDVVYRDITVEYDDVIPVARLQKSDDDVYQWDKAGSNPHLIGIYVIFHREYSAGGSRRGKNSRLRYENIRFYGRQMPAFYMQGYDSEHMVSDVTIADFYVNDQKADASMYELITQEFCRDIWVLQA